MNWTWTSFGSIDLVFYLCFKIQAWPDTDQILSPKSPPWLALLCWPKWAGQFGPLKKNCHEVTSHKSEFASLSSSHYKSGECSRAKARVSHCEDCEACLRRGISPPSSSSSFMHLIQMVRAAATLCRILILSVPSFCSYSIPVFSHGFFVFLVGYWFAMGSSICTGSCIQRVEWFVYLGFVFWEPRGFIKYRSPDFYLFFCVISTFLSPTIKEGFDNLLLGGCHELGFVRDRLGELDWS